MNQRLLVLGAVAALLGAYVAVENAALFQTTGSDAPAVVATAPRKPGLVKLNPLEGLDPASYPDILGRPLFNPGRKPRPPEPEPVQQPVVEQPVEQPPPPPQGPGPEDYKLLGVSSGPDGRIAALRIAASGEVVYVRKGAAVDSWSVIDVGERSVAIGTPQNAVTFSMFVNTDQPPPADGTAPAPAPPQLNQSTPKPQQPVMPQPAATPQ